MGERLSCGDQRRRRRLTLPSRGPVPASRAWPLMSNVRLRGESQMRAQQPRNARSATASAPVKCNASAVVALRFLVSQRWPPFGVGRSSQTSISPWASPSVDLASTESGSRRGLPPERAARPSAVGARPVVRGRPMSFSRRLPPALQVSQPGLAARSVASAEQAGSKAHCAVKHRAASPRAKPNPSLEATATGLALGPRSGRS